MFIILEGIDQIALSKSHGVWVPASAGTTHVNVVAPGFS
jgi:hypothetical protein